MMKIFQASDIHCEMNPKAGISPANIPPGTNVAVYAGDIDRYDRIVDTVTRMTPAHVKTIVFVTGNHEYYGAGKAVEQCDYLIGLAVKRWNAENPDRELVFLNNSSHGIWGRDGIIYRFMGGTLWTNYELFGSRYRNEAMARCAFSLNDHRKIAGLFTPEKSASLFEKTASYIRGELEAIASHNAGMPEGQTQGRIVPIVVTHHAPDIGAVTERYINDITSAGFASNIPGIDFSAIPLWMYGHCHGGNTFSKDGCLISCCTLGYNIEKPDKLPAEIILSGGQVTSYETVPVMRG